jgi:pimeloyl-ACP methyl ester carboxylesterase
MPTVETNGVETYYEHRGRGPPVVFVHGASNDCRWWEPQMTSFADDYEVVAYDVRGHGRTGGSDRSRYSMDLFAADLRALVAELDLDSPVVVGHSLGGMFALEYAARYPDALRGLVLADSQVAPGLTSMQTVVQHGLIPLQIGIQRVLGPDRASALTEWIARRLTEVDGPEDDELAAYAEETDEMFAPEEALKVLGAVRRFERPDLSSIEAPTLGVYGKEDPEMMHRNAVELAREVSRAELRLVPEAGHGLTREQPAAFERTVRKFLEKENVAPEEA